MCINMDKTISYSDIKQSKNICRLISHFHKEYVHHHKDRETADSKKACFSLHIVFPTLYYPHGTYSMVPDPPTFFFFFCCLNPFLLCNLFLSKSTETSLNTVAFDA